MMPTNDELAGLAAAYRAAGIPLPLPSVVDPNTADARPSSSPRRRRLSLVPAGTSARRPAARPELCLRHEK